MKYRLFSEEQLLYSINSSTPNTTCISLRLKDPVKENILKRTFKTAIKRYPYFQVKLGKDDEGVFFEDNHEEVAIINTDGPVTLGGAESNGHLLAVSWSGNMVRIHFHQALTDLTGIYQLIKTFLYYYCSKYYSTTLSSCRIRFTGEEPAEEEWADPLNREDTGAHTAQYAEIRHDIKETSLSSSEKEFDYGQTFSLRISEKEYMDITAQLKCAPENLAVLLLARVIRKVKEAGADQGSVTVAVSDNWRKALNVPLAHQPLTGNIRVKLAEKVLTETNAGLIAEIEKISSDALKESAINNDIIEFRKEIINGRLLLSQSKRREYFTELLCGKSQDIDAAVVFPGMADYDDAEQFVKEIHISSSCAAMGLQVPVMLTLTNMNGYLYMDIQQRCGKSIEKLFTDELDHIGLKYEMLELDGAIYPKVSDEVISLID